MKAGKPISGGLFSVGFAGDPITGPGTRSWYMSETVAFTTAARLPAYGLLFSPLFDLSGRLARPIHAALKTKT